jgi:hypothetical protein
MKSVLIAIGAGLGCWIPCAAFGQNPSGTSIPDVTIWTIAGSIGAVCAGVAAIISAALALKASKRADMLFQAQNQPRIQARAVEFLPDTPKKNFGMTLVELNNYSLADAYDVVWDLRYTGDPIVTWIKGRIRDLEKKGGNITLDEQAELNMHKSALLPRNLRAGEAIRFALSGSVPPDLANSARANSPFPIALTVEWRSNEGQAFKESQTFSLICTRVGTTEVYSFL